MPFPTATDLAFYQARHQPRWASRIARHYKPPSLEHPNIDDVVNAHAGARIDTAAHNLCVFIRSWARQGLDVVSKLREISIPRGDPFFRRQEALAKKWADRMERS